MENILLLPRYVSYFFVYYHYDNELYNFLDFKVHDGFEFGLLYCSFFSFSFSNFFDCYLSNYDFYCFNFYDYSVSKYILPLSAKG